MRTKINFNHLECFFSLARTLSFSNTSKELNIAQPAVSKQIKSLEDQMNTQLFIRTRQKVQLSPEGARLFDSTWKTYQMLTHQLDSFVDLHDGLIGTLTFGCLEEVGENIFIHLINEFKLKHPNIIFVVKFLKAYEIIEEVKQGRIDVGIVPNKIDQENISIYEIQKENIILTTSKENADKDVSDLSQLSFVAFRENDPLLDFYIRKVYPHSKSTSLRREFYVNSHKAMIAVIKKHNLYAVLPTLSIMEELESGALINAGPKDLVSPLYLMHLNHAHLDKKIKVFRSFLRKKLKASK